MHIFVISYRNQPNQLTRVQNLSKAAFTLALLVRNRTKSRKPNKTKTQKFKKKKNVSNSIHFGAFSFIAATVPCNMASLATQAYQGSDPNNIMWTRWEGDKAIKQSVKTP